MARAGAPISEAKKWSQINWKIIQRNVRRLQMRIAKAVVEGRWNKARALQCRLTNSFQAKLLAVKRVTSNKGKKTPGVDGILWTGARAKWQATLSLFPRGYKPQPLRRIYIPKKNGKKRPLSIPTMLDRAMQALYKLALDGLAQAIQSAIPPRNSRVNFVRDADDFIVTAKSKRLLNEQVKPAIESFLSTRGLELSEEKTVITHITQGFTFLGQSFRKQGNVLHITPSQTAVLSIIIPQAIDLLDIAS
jgi:retron-type reverse transcriptase